MQVYLTEHALPDREERGQRSAEPQGSTMPLLDNVEMLRVIFWTRESTHATSPHSDSSVVLRRPSEGAFQEARHESLVC